MTRTALIASCNRALTQTRYAGPRHKELVTGLNGSGHRTWFVVTVQTATGIWIHREGFDTEAEAANWLKWA